MKLEALVDELKAENKRLLLRIQVLEKELYGSRAERRKVKEDDPNQNSFPGMEEAEGMAQDSSNQAQTAQPPARKRNLSTKTGVPKGRKPLNPNLPRVEEFIADPDLKDLICPITGKAMHLILIDNVSVLARKPAEYFVRVLKRRVFGVPGGDSVVYSPWPADVMPRNRLDASVLGALICHRFADHQPYYRQSKQLERHGVQIARHTMTSLVALAERKLECIYDAIVKQTLASGYLMMDPTPVRLKSETRKGSTKEACVWTYRALDGPVFFEFAGNKTGETPAKTLQSYEGILQTDGASNFGGVPDRENIVHLCCWAHVRRYFLRAEDGGDPGASPFLDWIDRLFHRERLARRLGLPPEKVLELRRRFSLPEVDALIERARDFIAKHPMQKTPLAKAATYVVKRVAPLRECFLHAPSRIDNNLAENSLRPIKLGAKNWLFVGHENAGPRMAKMYTLVENCRMLDLNPEEYLIDVLARVDDHPLSRIEELTPAGWRESKNS